MRGLWRQPGRVARRKGAWLWQTLIQQGPEVTARFAAYYTQLRALPRHSRRALGKRWATSLASLAFLLAVGYAQAATMSWQGERAMMCYLGGAAMTCSTEVRGLT